MKYHYSKYLEQDVSVVQFEKIAKKNYIQNAIAHLLVDWAAAW